MSDMAQEGQAMELLPCPFCGEKPEHDYFPVSRYPHEIYCEKCIGVVATQQATLDECKDAWNRRPAPPPPVAASVPRDIAETIVRWAELLHAFVMDTREHNIDVSDTLRKEITAVLGWLAASAAPSPASGGMPREVAQTLREALYEWRRCLTRYKPNDLTQSRLTRVDAALAWLEQHAPSED